MPDRVGIDKTLIPKNRHSGLDPESSVFQIVMILDAPSTLLRTMRLSNGQKKNLSQKL
jgi:hypothetical protein